MSDDHDDGFHLLGTPLSDIEAVKELLGLNRLLTRGVQGTVPGINPPPSPYQPASPPVAGQGLPAQGLGPSTSWAMKPLGAKEEEEAPFKQPWPEEVQAKLNLQPGQAPSFQDLPGGPPRDMRASFLGRDRCGKRCADHWGVECSFPSGVRHPPGDWHAFFPYHNLSSVALMAWKDEPQLQDILERRFPGWSGDGAHEIDCLPDATDEDRKSLPSWRDVLNQG